MNAHNLVTKLLEADPDEIDPKHYVRTAWPQKRMRFLHGERVRINKRGWPLSKATIVSDPANNPEFVWVHIDGHDPGEDEYFHVDDLESLVEAVDPDTSSKGYAQHLARKVSRQELLSTLRAKGIQSPDAYSNGTERISINGLFFGYGEEGAKRLVQSVLNEYGLDIYYWGFEPYEAWSFGTEQTKTSREPRWWKFVVDVPRIHFSL